MTAQVHDPVNLMMQDGRPARFFWQERWSVTSATAEDFDYLGDDSRVVGWHVTAQTEDQSDAAEFDLTRDFTSAGWFVESVSYR